MTRPSDTAPIITFPAILQLAFHDSGNFAFWAFQILRKILGYHFLIKISAKIFF